MTEKQRKEPDPMAEDSYDWVDAPGEPDVAGAPGEFVDVGPNPPGETGESSVPGTPKDPPPAPEADDQEH